MPAKKDVVITDFEDAYIKQLEADKQAIVDKINILQSEVKAINSLIYRRKSALIAESTGENRNLKNADRLFFETIILDILNKSKLGLRTSGIYKEVSQQGYGVNYNTLRSYIAQMRDKGLIRKRAPTSYYWITASDVTAPSEQS